MSEEVVKKHPALDCLEDEVSKYLKRHSRSAEDIVERHLLETPHGSTVELAVWIRNEGTFVFSARRIDGKYVAHATTSIDPRDWVERTQGVACHPRQPQLAGAGC